MKKLMIVVMILFFAGMTWAEMGDTTGLHNDLDGVLREGHLNKIKWAECGKIIVPEDAPCFKGILHIEKWLPVDRPTKSCHWDFKKITIVVRSDERCTPEVKARPHYTEEEYPELFREILREHPGWEILQFNVWYFGVIRNNSRCDSAVQNIDIWLKRQVCQ